MHELCRAKRSAIVAESVAELYLPHALIVAESAAMEYYERIVDQTVQADWLAGRATLNAGRISQVISNSILGIQIIAFSRNL